MRGFIRLASLPLFASLVVATLAHGAEVGAIKRFVSFPVDTYEETGRLTDVVLEEDTTPPTASISVDGWWPDKKLLLISFGSRDNAHFILYRAVEMNDQANWDTRMTASGNLVCGGRTASHRTGGNPGTTTAATKGFTNPC